MIAPMVTRQSKPFPDRFHQIEPPREERPGRGGLNPIGPDDRLMHDACLHASSKKQTRIMPYEISSTTNAKFMFNLKAENHQVILTSQVYEQKQSALDGIASVQANGPFSKNYEHKLSTASQPYFVLKAQNGEIIGNSQMYSSQAAAEAGISSVQINSRSEEITTVE
jgi:uncharacterized protein